MRKGIVLSALSNEDPECALVTYQHLIRISNTLQKSLSKTSINVPEGTNFPLKSVLESLLPKKDSSLIDESLLQSQIRDFCLCCAGLASAEGEAGALMSSIPSNLSFAAKVAFQELSETLFSCPDGGLAGTISCECKLVVEMMPDLLPLLKKVIKDSSIDSEADEIVAASARVPVGSAILAAYQFRWLVTKVGNPHFGKLCSLIIPCALTALDHWSPEVKGQAMVSFIHMMKNVNAAEIGSYEDVILDVAYRNIPSCDELWHHVVEMSVLLLVGTQRRNPRSPWFEKILSEMLGHLERQPKNTERRIAWLELIDQVFDVMGLFLLAHFRRLFPLFFLWMHADDDKTVILVLERVCMILKLTWIRKTQYVERLVDELVLVYKESAVRKDRETIRVHIVRILVLLHNCMNQNLEAAWGKHKDDPNLTALASSFKKMQGVK
ncbi:uncharacterized protein At2g39910 [Aristolochia californica]|uniref:uncharacterized protein At2g39910 n=1 Tax=Aristolochia californica TaxID=171875 RepID=UPI0035D8F5B4